MNLKVTPADFPGTKAQKGQKASSGLATKTLKRLFAQPDRPGLPARRLLDGAPRGRRSGRARADGRAQDPGRAGLAGVLPVPQRFGLGRCPRGEQRIDRHRSDLGERR